MSNPEVTPEFIPSWDETKLAKTEFVDILDKYANNLEKIRALEEANRIYKDQMGALQMRYKLPAVRVSAFVTRWVAAGKPGRKLEPKLLLAAGVKMAQIEKGYIETKPRAAYFAVYPPKQMKVEEEE